MAKPAAIATQQFIDIESVENGVVILKNGGLRRVLMVSGINFDLKSEEEQQLILYAYQNFLNSLDFSLQHFIHSRKLNIENYLKNLEQFQVKETNELLKNQIGEYREFIRSFVAENAIMAKTFFLIVPFDPIALAEVGKTVTGKFLGIFGKKQKTSEREELMKERTKHVSQLSQRVDQVISGLAQAGLRAVPLEDEELIELFYNLYNPEAIEKAGLAIAKE